MEEPYRIEVLHAVNPHIIFVESQASKGEPVIQQIGIYGILPVNKTVDIEGLVVAERCDNWPVAANTILNELFCDYKNGVYFVPMQVENRSTIFDENTHQFGDIIIKTGKGKKLSVTDHLLKLAVAEKDEYVFQQKLNSGKLKIKLNTTRTEEILKTIKKYYQKQKKVDHDWQKTINKQTLLYQETKKVSSVLTEKNLKLLEKNTHGIKNVMETIEQKERDFNLCKNADVVGIGCGSRRKLSRPNSNQLKKFATQENDEIRPANVLNDMKSFLEAHGTMKDMSNYDDFNCMPQDGTKQSTPFPNSNLHKTAKSSSSIKRDIKPNQKASSNQDKDNQNVKPNESFQNFVTQYQHPEMLARKYYTDEEDDVMPLKQYNNQNLQDSQHQKEESQNKKNEKHPQKKYVQDINQNISSNNYSSQLKNQVKTGKKSKILEKHDPKSYSLDESWDNSTNDHDENELRGPFKTSPLKPREHLRVYCPDMEMSSDNCKNLVPIKIVEQFVTDCPKNTNTQVENDSSNVNGDHSVETEVNIKSTSIEKFVGNSYDETDYKNRLNNDKQFRDIKANAQNMNSKTKTTLKTSTPNVEHRLVSSILRKKLEALKESQKLQANISTSSNSDTSVKDTSSSTEQSKSDCNHIKETNIVVKQSNIHVAYHIIDDENENINLRHLNIDLEHPGYDVEKPKIKQILPLLAHHNTKTERNVNPFKNLDGSKSVFVDKLVTPILMVHTKNDNLILPQCELRDIPFKADIHCMLRNMRLYNPMRLQSVSWSCILRGHSVFMISAAGNGKTLGYVPAVCNIVTDSLHDSVGVGPFCIIVCATALSVSEVETYCKRFLGLQERIVACFPGIDPTSITTALLNGCHVLICTAPMLVSLLEDDFGVDLRRLMVLVFDDCERISEVYSSELVKILQHVKVMLKKRSDKSLKVQYVVASRQWCDFMTPLAIKAPDTVIVIGASQECVLYSKSKTSVNFVQNKANKVNTLLEFLEEIDTSKRTVIACRDDDEVILLENLLKKLRHTIFPCNSTMTIHDLYQINEAWGSYKEPVLGPILICCDGNLTHLNITNANYLVHFSMPPLFSMFCKRFSVLNENYSSIFAEKNENVKIKILLDKTNVEQLPKILHFVMRCTKQSFPMLDTVLQEVLKDKDLKKAETMTPICNTLLMLGECIDMAHCPDRHTIFEQFDEPKKWVPRQGVVTFKIMHVDTAVTYSARVLSLINNGGTTKYPNNYNTLSIKMGMYYSKETNRKLQGTPILGDICAVAAKQDFFERCQVVKIIPSGNEKSVHVLVNLLDEEKLVLTKDVYLYYLPDEFKAIETHIVKIRLANIHPKDNDVTFSVAAKNRIRSIVERDTENELYIRGRIVMTLGNTIYVDTAEVCADLSSLGETVVRRDLRKELLERHAELYPQHIEKLKKLGGKISLIDEKDPKVPSKIEKPLKWAYLEKDDFSAVFLSTVVDPGTLFVRLAKFEKVINLLHSDIKEFVEKAPGLDSKEIYVGNIILAEFPDDKTYERARIDAVVDDSIIKCFFVDHGDWRQIPKDKLRPITENILHRTPFQAIECRLVGIKPPGDDNTWPEFAIAWLEDSCFEDKDNYSKCLYVKYFTKEKAAITGGHKYGVVLFDTTVDPEIVVNKKIIELNLAKENTDESKYIDQPLNINRADSASDEDYTIEDSIETTNIKDLVPLQSTTQVNNDDTDYLPHRNILFEKPIRSVPLVPDSDSDDFDDWDVNVDKDLLGMFGPPRANITKHKSDKDATDENTYIGKERVAHKLNSNKSPEKEALASEIIINKELTADLNHSPDRSSGSNVSRTENSKENSELMLKSPTLESETDSDDIDIGSEKIAALDIFKRKFINNDISEKFLVNKDFVKNVLNSKIETLEHGHTMNKTIDKPKKNDTLDSDDFSSIASEHQKSDTVDTNPKITEVEPHRKPKLVWRQNKAFITLKINLIGVEDYDLEINERNIRFHTWHNDTTYEFDFVLYGVVSPQKSVHSNKGQYIQVHLKKMLQRNWSNLTKDCSSKKWIVYDVDAIDLISDEEEGNNEAIKAIKQNHDKVDSESEDEDFKDDLTYKRYV